MGLVLWVDKNTFATGLIEKVFKKRSLPFYTVDQAKDFAYLVEDLKPEVIVLDGKTAVEESAFREHFEINPSLKEARYILINPTQDLEFIPHVIGTLSRPFNPFEVPAEIEKILNGLN